jgi:hypothetical protein
VRKIGLKIHFSKLSLISTVIRADATLHNNKPLQCSTVLGIKRWKMLVFLFYFSHNALKMLHFCVLSTNVKFIEAVFKNSSKKSKAKYIEKQKAEKYRSVSRFQEKEKRGEMITINDNIKW